MKQNWILGLLVGLLLLGGVAMAATSLTRTDTDDAGIAVSYSEMTIDANYEFANDGRTFLLLKNDEASTSTVTITTGGTISGFAIADLTVTVGPSATQLVGSFPASPYNDSSGKIGVSCATTTCTIAVYRLKN